MIESANKGSERRPNSSIAAAAVGRGRARVTESERGAAERLIMRPLSHSQVFIRLMSAMTDSLTFPLPQSPEFARACDLLSIPLRLLKRESRRRVTLSWQVQSRHFGPLGRVDLVSRGPVADEPGALEDWARRWRHWHDGRPLILNADGIDARTLCDSGFWPLMTPASLALLPLGPDAQMRAALHQKWRNRLNRVLREDVTVTSRVLPPDHWVLAAEVAQARAKGYRGLPPGVSVAFARANPGAARVYEARHSGRPVAAALVLRHGRMATWQIGHSTEQGRQINAMNLVLWEAMRDLHARGHDLLDLGVLNTDDAPGLTRFKLGTGAVAHRLGGTWLHIGCLAPVARWLPQRLCA